MLSFYNRAVMNMVKSPLGPASITRAFSNKTPVHDATKSVAANQPVNPEWPFGPEQSSNPNYFTSPRRDLTPDGTAVGMEKYHFEWDDYNMYPHQKLVKVKGKTHIWGEETKKFEQLHRIPHKNIPLKQTNIPFVGRQRLKVYPNYTWNMAMEWCFFWGPSFIVAMLAIPSVVLTYMQDEAVNSTMTVKVIGQQWYWTYEVEAPVVE